MTPNIRVFSIPHSGTHSTVEFLRANGVDCSALHLTGDNTDDVDGCIVVCPVRKPDNVLESWRKRYTQDGADLSRWKEWEASWEQLATTEGHLFFVDEDLRREKRLLGDFLGVKLKGEFPQENHSDEEVDRDAYPVAIERARDIYQSLVESRNGLSASDEDSQTAVPVVDG